MEQFGKYQLIHRIGSGGMAEVFLARTTVARGLSKDLVIKKIHPPYADSPHFVSMFVAEAEIALSLNHPNIVQVFDFGVVGGTFFLAMEYVEGLDLLRLLHTCRQNSTILPLELAAYLTQEIARGLDYAHRKTDRFGEPLGIVHRDISPQNSLVSWDGAVKIVDFGVARARGIHEAQGTIKGKYRYMAPEQARGEEVDRRADVYSAGAVLFELCCGRPMYHGNSREILDQARAGAVVRPREVNGGIDPDLEAIILRALAFHPDDRYSHARDLQQALGHFLLQRAQKSGFLTDADTVAHFLDTHVPPSQRTHVPEPPRPVVRRRADPALRLDLLEREETTGEGTFEGPTEVRERKHILVVTGRIHLALPQAIAGAGRPPSHTGETPIFTTTQTEIDWAQTARDIAFKYHARMHQLTPSSFTLLVGMPVATEDDPSRTITMALALIDAVDAIAHERNVSMGLSIGMQRGIATIGHRAWLNARAGATAVEDIEVEPQATEVAHALAIRAKAGEILVSSGVYQVARDEWRFDGAEALGGAHLDTTKARGEGVAREGGDGAVRGDVLSAEHGGHATQSSETDVPIYRLLGPKARAERLREQAAISGMLGGALIGRDIERKALQDAYRDVSTRGGIRYVFVTGEPGVGKRALVNAFVHTIPAGHAVMMRAVARSATSLTPYSLISDLARNLFEIGDNATDDEISARKRAVIAQLYPDDQTGAEARTIGKAVDLLLRHPLPAGVSAGLSAGRSANASASTNVSAEERRTYILQGMLAFESRLARDKPLIAVCEDAHWSDDESLELLRALYHEPHNRPILVVLTSRANARVAGAAAAMDADIIRLDELDARSSITLITRQFIPEQDVSELARQIIARTGGNPFFIREVLESLRERGIVVYNEPEATPHSNSDSDDGSDDGDQSSRDTPFLRWADQSAPIRVPSSVESVLAARIDALPTREKQVLMYAAVLGRTSSRQALEGLLEFPAQTELDDLVERRLMHLGSGERYTFASKMMRTVAYELLPLSERTRLHRRAAHQLTHSPDYRGRTDDAAVAQHLELAGDGVAAVDYYLSAANHAVTAGGNGDALRLLSRAIKLTPYSDHQRRFEIYRQREEILGRTAHRSEQLRLIQSMGRAAEALGAADKMALAFARLARFHIAGGSGEAAAKAAAPALHFAQQADEPLLEAEALRLQAEISRLAGRGNEALELSQQALSLCDDEHTGLAQRASILNTMGNALWLVGRLEACIEAYAESLVIYRNLSLPRYEARAINNMANVFAALGEYEDAISHYKHALQIDQRLGDRAALASKLSNIGQTYADVGDLRRAERYLERALSLSEQLKDLQTEADAAISLGQVHLQSGRTSSAPALFSRGLELAREGRNRYQEIRARIYLALARLEGGTAPRQIYELARAATKQAEEVPMPVGQIFGLAVQALALQKLDDLQRAADASQCAVTLQSEQPRSEGSEQILYIHAITCEAAGRIEEARTAIRQARREIEDKAGRLRDPGLEAQYLSSYLPAAIMDASERILTQTASV